MPRRATAKAPEQREETVGDRLYLIRLSCGDGRRDPMPLAKFSAYVREATGVYYDPATLSLLERMRQSWRLDDVAAFAAADPQQRGERWLAFGAPPPLPPGTLKPHGNSGEE